MQNETALVEIDWEGTEIVWVSVSPRWKESRQPTELAGAILAAVQDRRSGETPDRADFTAKRDLSWEDVIELGHLIRDYNEQRRAQLDEYAAHGTAPLSTESRHGKAVWRGGQLVNLWLDGEWLSSQTTQAINEEVTELLRAGPDYQSLTHRPALHRSIQRLERFWS